MQKTNLDIDLQAFSTYMLKCPKEWFKLIGHHVHHPLLGDGKIAYHIPGKGYNGGVFAVTFDNTIRSSRKGSRRQVMIPMSDFLGGEKITFDIPNSLYQRMIEYQLLEEEAARKRKRTEKLRGLCEQQGIDYLFHFTRAENLASIFENGLLSRNAILQQSHNDPVVFNDPERLDKHEEGICLSVGYPNYRVFYRFRNRFKTNWVVILLKKDILWELDSAFYQENAASQRMVEIPLEKAKEVDSFSSMFVEKFGTIQRKELGIPNKFTTNPQAEVLIFDPIPLRYIHEIHFLHHLQLNEWRKGYGSVSPVTILVNPSFFSPRIDYTFWQSTTPIPDISGF